MGVNLSLSEIMFKNGLKVDLNKNDIVVFVGPNNAGKSTAVTEIFEAIKGSVRNKKIVQQTKIRQEGTREEFRIFLEGIQPPDTPSNQLRGFKFGASGISPLDNWEHSRQMGLFGTVFANSISTSDRLSGVGPAPNIPLISSPAQHPIHFLQRDSDTEEKFIGYFRQAYGMDLAVMMVTIAAFMGFGCASQRRFRGSSVHRRKARVSFRRKPDIQVLSGKA